MHSSTIHDTDHRSDLMQMLSRTTQSLHQYAMGWVAKESEFDSRREQEICVSSKASRLALWPTQSPVHWVPGSLFSGLKWLGHEVDHSPTKVPRQKPAPLPCCPADIPHVPRTEPGPPQWEVSKYNPNLWRSLKRASNKYVTGMWIEGHADVHTRHNIT
jgi:hypothetical protein